MPISVILTVSLVNVHYPRSLLSPPLIPLFLPYLSLPFLSPLPSSLRPTPFHSRGGLVVHSIRSHPIPCPSQSNFKSCTGFAVPPTKPETGFRTWHDPVNWSTNWRVQVITKLPEGPYSVSGHRGSSRRRQFKQLNVQKHVTRTQILHMQQRFAHRINEFHFNL